MNKRHARAGQAVYGTSPLRAVTRGRRLYSRTRRDHSRCPATYHRPVTEDDHRKQAEIDYPGSVGEVGRGWFRTKPFRADPRPTGRLLIDFGYVLQLLDLHAGSSVVELGCGSGWMMRLPARPGGPPPGPAPAPPPW